MSFIFSILSLFPIYIDNDFIRTIMRSFEYRIVFVILISTIKIYDIFIYSVKNVNVLAAPYWQDGSRVALMVFLLYTSSSTMRYFALKKLSDQL